MKALYFDGTNLRLETEYPNPRRGPGEALIRVLYAGICGTDLEILKGYARFKGVPGHEFVGVVEEADNKELVGKRVVGEINVGCGNCTYCLRGLERHCPERKVLGIKNLDGTFAEYILLPEKNLHILPPEIPDEAAVLVEPLAASYEILEQLHIQPESRVLVLGDGRMGNLIAQVMHTICPNLLVAGKRERKLTLLRKLGIKAVNISELREREAFDIVIEATGRPAGIIDAINFVKPRGTIILKTTIAEETILNLSPIVVKEVTLLGSRCGPFKPAINALKRGIIKVKQLIDAIYPLDEWKKAFNHAQSPNTLKILLKP